VTVYLNSSDPFTSLRVLDFSGLTTQSSFTVRTNVLRNLVAAEDSASCGSICQTIGHGYRASTDFLLVHPPAPLVATFDNSFATLWFDFRLIGVLIAVAIVWPLFASRSRGFKTVLVASTVVLGPSLFFDALYSFGMVSLTGLVLGTLISSSSSGPASLDAPRHAEENEAVPAR
jgi:hypothetical protein